MNTKPTCTLNAESILANARNLVPAIRGLADTIETARRLPASLVDQMTAAGIFRIATPRAWGGPEMSRLPQIDGREAGLTATAPRGDRSVAAN